MWADAAAGIGAYQPPPAGAAATSAVGATTDAPETVEGAPDWRGLLDLLDEGGAASYDDLWRTVGRARRRPRPARRADGRSCALRGGGRGGRGLAAAAAVRDALRAWQFDDANRLLGAAEAVLAERTAIAGEAAAAGLTTPVTLRTAFESPDGFASATLEAAAEREAIARYTAAVAARPAAAVTDVVQEIGLWGTTPQADLDAARTLFATGDLAGAAEAATAAASAWSSAADIGRGRLATLGIVAVAILSPSSCWRSGCAPDGAVAGWHHSGRGYRGIARRRAGSGGPHGRPPPTSRHAPPRPASPDPDRHRGGDRRAGDDRGGGRRARRGSDRSAPVGRRHDLSRRSPRAVVHVTLDITATNLKPDTATRYYWYDAFWFYVHRQARLGHGDVQRIASGRLHQARRRFAEGHGPHPEPLLPARPGGSVSPSISPTARRGPRTPSASAGRTSRSPRGRGAIAGLGSVKVVLPPGFNSRVKTTPSDSGHALHPEDGRRPPDLQHEPDRRPYSWSATIEGSNADALTNAPVDRSGEAVLVHAWPEDTRWRQRVETVIGDSLPDLKAAIGLPWPNTRPLDVTEVAAADIAGYAGIYDTSYDDIVISEDLDDLTIVHEVSHAWFNDGLFQERWVGEGLAEEYAARILSARSGAARQEPVPLSPVGRGLFQLNDWPRPSTDRPNEMYEAFGYNTSWAVMRAIVDDVTEAKMRDVFEAAAAEKLTYVGSGARRVLGLRPGLAPFPGHRRGRRRRDTSRGALRGLGRPAGATGRDDDPDGVADALLRSRRGRGGLVAGDRHPRPDEQLAVRRRGRRDGRGRGRPGRPGHAGDRGDRARSGTAGRSGERLRDGRFDRRPAGHRREARRLDRDLDPGRSGARRARSGSTPLVALGLLDARPDADYAAAVAAYAAGDAKAALAGSAGIVSLVVGAEAIGGQRATLGAGIAGMAMVLLVLAAFLVIRRRRRGPRSTPAQAAASGPDPYATLAASPDPAGPVEVGDDGARGAKPD